MHSCPECGQTCYCHGDIDDCEVETEEYSYLHCTCPGSRDCMENQGDYSWDERQETVASKSPTELERLVGERVGRRGK